VPRFVIACCLAALLLGSRAAHAQPAPDTARANTLGHEALEAFRKNDWTGAFQRFSLAEQAAHSPVFLLYMARCKRNAGELLAARDLLARAAGEVLPDSATAPWKTARADAGRELGELLARIPSIVVAVRGADAAVTVDGKPVPPATLRAPIRLNPGPHAVVATVAGRAPVAATVTLVEGDAPQRVDLVFPEVAKVVLPEVPKIAPPKPPAEPPVLPPKRGSLVPGVVGLGVGGAGLLAGVVLSAVAKSKATTATEACKDLPGGGLSCPTSARPDIELAQTLATGANVAFVAGGVVAATGLVLVLVRPGGSKPSVKVAPGVGTIAIYGNF
jgi:hypothetical protein